MVQPWFRLVGQHFHAPCGALEAGLGDVDFFKTRNRGDLDPVEDGTEFDYAAWHDEYDRDYARWMQESETAWRDEILLETHEVEVDLERASRMKRYGQRARFLMDEGYRCINLKTYDLVDLGLWELEHLEWELEHPERWESLASPDPSPKKRNAVHQAFKLRVRSMQEYLERLSSQ